MYIFITLNIDDIHSFFYFLIYTFTHPWQRLTISIIILLEYFIIYFCSSKHITLSINGIHRDEKNQQQKYTTNIHSRITWAPYLYWYNSFVFLFCFVFSLFKMFSFVLLIFEKANENHNLLNISLSGKNDHFWSIFFFFIVHHTVWASDREIEKEHYGIVMYLYYIFL